jgi:5,10-methenyltetrahydrofolate synthetase
MQDEKKPLLLDSKPAARRTLMTTRQALAAPARQRAEKAIAQHLQTWLEQHQPAVLAAYLPIQGEVDCRDWLLQSLRAGVKIVLPVVEQRAGVLVFRQWNGETLIERDLAGVPAPLGGVELRPDALLIPCLGFDAQGYRLGYGGGYYDRTLAVWPDLPRAGVAFGLQATCFPVDQHDIALHAVITERGVQNF